MLLAVMRAALRLLPFDRVRAMAAASPVTAQPSPLDGPLAVRRAVLRATRALPGSSCLAQSLVAARMLRERGHAARLSIGVAESPRPPGAGGALDAHAWVESGGLLVTGDDPGERYRVIATFGSA